MDTTSMFLLSIISLALGLPAGFIMHRSDYCLAGMFRDFFLFKHTVMLRTLLVLVVTSMLLFEGARVIGILPSYPFPLLYSPTPMNFIGGVIFGIGMVLAGGCVVGTLYKMGAGSFLSALAFVGLVIGSALYAEFHPTWAALIKDTTFLSDSITVPQVLGVSPTGPVLVVAAVSIFLLLSWHKKGGLVHNSYAEGYIQPWKAAMLLSLLSLISYLLIGMPMGVTTTYAKIAGFIESIFASGHYESLAVFKAVPLSYTHPLTGATLEGGAAPIWDAISAIQIPLIGGIILGSAASAIMLREFKVIFRAPARQYASVILGGILMGLASRMAPTCNVWHLLGGLPLLAVSSILFLLGLFPGAWIGGILLVKLVMGKGAK